MDRLSCACAFDLPWRKTNTATISRFGGSAPDPTQRYAASIYN